jgi:glycosyltransferase involved in cell wall biosynthesis
VPEPRIARAIGYRAFGRSLGARTAIVKAGARRYRSMFVSELAQIACFAGPTVADVDDPSFSDHEVDLLQRPNVVAYTVTAQRAAERYAASGVDKPVHVVPQGVTPPDSALVAEARRKKRSGEIVVGYIAAHLLLSGDRGGANPLFNVEHLLEVWQEIRARVPTARLWLVGDASRSLRSRLARRDDVVLTGRLPPPQAIAHIAAFDIALYPRTQDQGIRAAKVGEYLGLGVPTVSYDYDVVGDLRESGAGVLVQTPREFVAAVERLARDDAERARLAASARDAGAARHWDVLAREMNAILDRYLSPT